MTFKFRNLHSCAVIAWFCVLLMDSIFALLLNCLKYCHDIIEISLVGLGQQCRTPIHHLHFQLIGTSMYII